MKLSQLAHKYIGGLAHAHTVLSNHPSHHESDLSVDYLVASLNRAGLAGSPRAPLQFVMFNEHPSDPSKPRRLGRLSLRGRRLLRQRRRPLVERVPIYYGLEVSILPSGQTDLTPRLADHCAMVIASRHRLPSGMNQDAETTMEQFKKACSNPIVDALGHPPRYIETLEGLDWSDLFDWAAYTGTAIEVNLASYPSPDSHPTQLKFWADWLHLLAVSKADVFIGTDIHNKYQLQQFILQWRSLDQRRGRNENQLARFITALDKAGITPDRVISRDYTSFSAWLQMDKAGRAKLHLQKQGLISHVLG